MPAFLATEFNVETVTLTGNVEIYAAENADEAARSCLYTKKLSNGRAKLGPTGRVVYDAKGSGWIITKQKTPEFKWDWQRTKEDLSPFECWMLKSNLEAIKGGVPSSERIALLREQGYVKLANAVEKALS